LPKVRERMLRSLDITEYLKDYTIDGQIKELDEFNFDESNNQNNKNSESCVTVIFNYPSA
jgi:hypothetical protein